MRKTILSIAIRKHEHRCERCQRRVRQGDDQVKVFRLGVTLFLHWHCWMVTMGEQDRRGADVVAEVVQ